ncbi:hypothetical protein ABZX62_26845 [Streptomyces flavidovirens]|uniref:hypothetical protein n=1 Tax=Streptomyces flavidovirens TaxID=67298 RepID=UPI0033A45D52
MTGAQGGGEEPRRFLIVAVVADYPKNRDWNRVGLVNARDRVVELFTGLTRTMLRGTRVRRVLLMLDACYVGQGGNQMAADALDVLITSVVDSCRS